MRPERTADEQGALNALKGELMSKGHEVEEIEEITDRPDAAFVIDGETIACECRIFTPQKLLQLHGHNMVNGELYQVFLPFEPHIWVQSCIEAKNPHIPVYKENAKATKVWLLVHATRGIFSNSIGSLHSSTFDLLKLAVWQAQHSFDRIYIASETDENAICIFDRSQHDEKESEYKTMEVLGVPVNISFFGKFTATEGPNGAGVISISQSLNEPNERFMLQPLDERFRVDYSGVNELSFSNIGRGNSGPSIYTVPVENEAN